MEGSLGTGYGIFWNDSQTAESIKEVKKLSVPVPSGRPKPFALQPSGKLRHEGPSRLSHSNRQHDEVIKCLEEQVIQEEGKSQIDFLSACQAVLNASPVELRGTLLASYHILIGQAPMSHPFSLSQGTSPAKQPPASAAPPALAPEHSPRPKRQIPSLDPVDHMPLGGTTSKATMEGPPSSRW